MTDGALPPLAAVRAFEAAARLGSFTRAARELGMTQAAVSYQVKALEDRVGAALFLRTPRQVALTDAGRRLSPLVTRALDDLRAAFAGVREDAAGVLTISSVHVFASNWLAPRLGAFQLANPGLAVRLEVGNRLTDFAREEVDVGIRSGAGPWPGLAAHALMPCRFTPLCSPDLLRRLGAPAAPADLPRLPLLTPSDSWWASWFELAGVPGFAPDERGAMRLDSQQMEGAAALAGQGVAILSPALWTAEVAAGRLVQPFPIVGDRGHAYWLVYPEARKGSRKIRALRDWLLAAVARSAVDASPP